MPRNEAHALGEQPAFSAALLDPDLPPPDGVIGPHGKAATKRFAVYRNNVTVSLINALADIFPAVAKLVGQDFFRDMARYFITRHPPHSALLFEYGHEFPEFLKDFEPVAKLPYLPDVARLERAWLDAFHAADAEPLTPEALGATPQERLGDLVFTPHPAARIVQSDFAAVSIFSASREDRPLKGIQPLAAEDGLITRPFDTVQVRQLPAGAASFFEALVNGRTLGAAAALTLDSHPGFDLPSAISALLEAGIFTTCHLENASSELPE